LTASYYAVFSGVDAWIDAYRNVSGSITFYTFYSPGVIISASNSNFWNVVGNNDRCARFVSSVGKYSAEPCNQNKDLMCEIVAF
jgi:hypothetical protein